MEKIKAIWNWSVEQADAHPRIFLIWALMATVVALF